MVRPVSLNTIYPACEGEGVHIGTPQIFIRLQGCAVGCINCDSKQTWKFDRSKESALSNVIDQALTISADTKIKRFSITGGDPLHPKNRPSTLDLIRALKDHDKNFYINIEATGQELDEEIFSLLDFLSLDYKTPSSGRRGKIEVLQETAKLFSHKMQVKSVIENRADFDFVKAAYLELNQNINVNFSWVLTPCYTPSEPFPMERFQNVLSWNMSEGSHFKVIGQQHKWVYGPNRENV